MAEDKAPERVPSRHELYLQELAEQRANEDKEPEAVEVDDAPYAVEGNETESFVGVSPEYKTYSGVFKQPLRAEDGVTSDSEVEAEERKLPLQSPARPPHPSTPLVQRASGESDAPAVVTEEDQEQNDDTPQLPPVPNSARSRRGTHSASNDDEN